MNNLALCNVLRNMGVSGPSLLIDSAAVRL